jgi:hypothetical protein
VRRIVLELDEDDYEAVTRAVSIRQGFDGGGLLPEGGGNLTGRIVAEICRGWEEMLDDHNPGGGP